MANFQFRVVGTYFGSPITEKPNFGAGYSTTGPVSVDIDGPSAPSVEDVMRRVAFNAATGQIPNCNGFFFSRHHPHGHGSNLNLYAVACRYTEDPITRQHGSFIYYLAENLTNPQFDNVLQYYIYEVPDPSNPEGPLTQINRAGDRIAFSQPLSDIPGFEYKPNGNYFIVWRMVTIATQAAHSSRLMARMDKEVTLAKESFKP